MTSYSSLTSRRIFVSRQHSTESDFEFPSMTKVFMESCLFIFCKTMFTIDESQAISHANGTANTRTPNCQSSQGKIWHRKILWSEERRLEIQRPKQQRWMEMVATNKRAWPWQRSFILDNIISYSNLWSGTRFSLQATHSFCFKMLEMWNIAQMLPKVRKSA